MDKNLKNKARDIYHENRSKSWIIALFFSAFFILFLLLGKFLPFVGIIIVPLLFLPLLFALVLTHLSFSYQNNFTFAGIFKYFRLYFSSPNFGAFDFLLNVIKSFGMYFLFSILFSILGFTICSIVDKEGIISALEIYYSYMANELDMDLVLALGEYQNIFFIFECTTLIPSVVLTNIYFIYKIIKNFLSIYLRLGYPKGNPNFIKSVYNYTLRVNKKELNKDFFYLNYPFFLLLSLGYILGIVFALLKYNDLIQVCYIGSFFAFILMSLFSSHLFANMEAIFNKYEEKFTKSSIIITNNYLSSLQNHIDLNEEEADKLKDILKDFKNPLEDENISEDEEN
jgi:hypothetical protein